jgi:hypothetical protein
MSDYTTEMRGRVGSSAANSHMADGTEAQLRFDNQGAAVNSQLHGPLTEQSRRGNIFTIGNQAGVITVIGLSTTHTGLCLSNPVGSNKLIALLKVGFGFIVAQPTTGSIFGLETGYHSSTNVTHTTPVAPSSCLVGDSSIGVGKGDVSATLPATPVLAMSFGSVLTSAITAGLVQPAAFFDIGGAIVLKPGGFVATYTTIASGAASMVASFTYEEIPLY